MDGVSRRGYLAGLVGVAALSGCQEVLDRTSDDVDGDPKEVGGGDDETAAKPEQVQAVERFYAALDAGRFDVANEVLHSESAESRVTEEQYGDLEEGSVSVESAELIAERKGRAVVRTNVRASSADPPREIDTTLDIELRLENGRWKLYSVESVDTATEGPGGEEEPTADDEPARDAEPDPAPTGDPRDVVREFYVALDDGDRVAANRLIHSEARDIEVTEQAADAMDDVSLTAENVRLVEERADSATVEATVTVSPLDSERERTNRVRVELRPEDGQWRIYASG